VPALKISLTPFRARLRGHEERLLARPYKRANRSNR
jgi:hypothetical protein